uniref:Uncharacterized protein n=1 Tax=Anguilla anguilla TaxID=7936 RepID=A0A0E9P806_ANGAN
MFVRLKFFVECRTKLVASTIIRIVSMFCH